MAKSLNFVNINVIANKIYQNPLLKDVNFEQIIDGVVTVIKSLRLPDALDINTCYVDIIDYKGFLKAPFISILSIDKVNGKSLLPMTVSNAHNSNTINKHKANNNLVYKINNRVINTGFKEGRIKVVFTELVKDPDGHPMIIDSEALIKAIVSYIKYEVYSVLFDLGKINERSLNKASQNYYFEIGQASSELKDFDNIDDMEAFIKDWKRPIQLQDTHFNRSNINDMKEYKKLR